MPLVLMMLAGFLGRHFATKPLFNAWGLLVFCFSLFDVPTACCDFPTPQRRDSFACLETVGVVNLREAECILLGVGAVDETAC